MTFRSATNRADLLRFQHDLQELGSVAALAGFERQLAADSIEIPSGVFGSPQRGRPTHSGDTPPEEPSIEIPEKRPPLEFFVPVRKETLKPLATAAPIGNPITDAELAVDWKVPAPAPRSLVPWARLAPFLKSRLGATLRGHRLDIRRLVRQAGQGLPVVDLPRLPRAVWASQALVMRDDSDEMIPFASDMRELLRRLRLERGASGLKVVGVRDVPRHENLRGLPPDVPILALTCLGRSAENEEYSEAWMRFGDTLLHRRQSATALMPCRLKLQGRASPWTAFMWDHRIRLPQRRGQRLPPSKPSVDDAPLETLLNLLSPASRVTSALLRDVRLLLGAKADVAIESEAWFHPGGWHSLDCFGFENGELRDARLERRKLLQAEQPDLVRAVDELIARHHEDCCMVVAGEAALRASFSSDRNPRTLEKTISLLRRVVDRLRLMAPDPGTTAGRRIGLAEWFTSFVATLPPAMRSDSSVADLVARGLALSHIFLESGTLSIPEGIDERVYRDETRASARRMPEARTVSVVLCPVRTHDTQLIGFSVQGRSTPPERHGTNLAHFAAQSRVIHLSGSHPRRIEFQDSPSTFFVPELDRPGEFSVQSDLEAVHFKAMPRPSWARRMWCDSIGLHAEADLNGTSFQFDWRLHAEVTLVEDPDDTDLSGRSGLPLRHVSPVSEGRWTPISPPPWASRLFVDEYGLAAEFRIRDVPFVLRWIPPGRFVMGSPEDEPGRWDDEGPQHEVRITQGFWMGEAPVTQAQWRAVVEAAGAQPSLLKKLLGRETLNSEPSHFKGAADLPVESVSWDDSRAFCQLLDAILPDGPGFRLPTEAQWEYACRAGTQTAFNDGSPCTAPEGNDPALDRLGWYSENSNRQTHPVRQKQANKNGLHDMHGNVWEWTRDPQRRYAKETTIDPHQDDSSSAGRVVRGGSWYNLAWFCRAAVRYGYDPGFRNSNLGLRLSAGQELETGAAEPQEGERSDLPERRSRARRAGGNRPA